MRTLDSILIYSEWWLIGTDVERELKESMLLKCFDDDDDDANPVGEA